MLGAIVPLLAVILLAAHPLLTLYRHNQTEVELGVLWWPFAVCAAVAAVLYGALLLIFKSPAKAGALASLVVIPFFFYGTYRDKVNGWGISERWFVLLWVLLFLVAAVLVAMTRRSLVNLMIALTVAAAVWAVSPTVKIARYEANHHGIDISDPRLWSTSLSPLPSGKRDPDIYVIVPDDYARSDVLRRYFHYDNSAFRRALKRRGFVLSDGVRSPYSDSEMNIAAEMNMDYVNNLARLLGPESQDVRPVRWLIHDNRASHLLKQIGYRYLHMDTDQVTFPITNPHISPIASPDTFVTLWMQGTALGEVGWPLGFSDTAANARFRTTVRDGFSKLENVPRESGPKFVLFHTIIPHDPYVFGPKGQAVTFPSTDPEGHTKRIGMTYYLSQLRYVETKLLETVDSIQARSKRTPVIVIMSDEGFEGNEAVLGAATVRDVRVKGFVAFHIPGQAKARPPRDLNTVNALRLVFNRVFGTDYPMLKSASYPEGDFPYQFEAMPVRGIAK